MQTVPKEWLDFLREQFPKNSRIQLTEMGDDSQSLPHRQYWETGLHR